MRYSYVCKYVSRAQNESMRGQIVERGPFQQVSFPSHEFILSFSEISDSGLLSCVDRYLFLFYTLCHKFHICNPHNENFQCDFSMSFDFL